jgi:hypothetical protein
MGLAAISGISFIWSSMPATAISLILTGLLGILAIIQESDFRPNWTHLIIPSRRSQNVTARINASDITMRDIVLVAHLDTHRTPWFNASRLGQYCFRFVFRAAIALLAAHVFLGAAALSPLSLELSWPALASSSLLTLFVLIFLQADLTQYSPGAYDNASGIASLLVLAARLATNPLTNCSVWIVLTGCEETGCAGMRALINKHSRDWQSPLIVNLDQMGSDQLYLRTCEGLLIRRCIQSKIRQLTRSVALSVDDGLIERESQAFSDAAVAHKYGIPAISLGSQPAEPGETTHRHRLSDLPEHIKQDGLVATQRFVWALLQEIDANMKQVMSDE